MRYFITAILLICAFLSEAQSDSLIFKGQVIVVSTLFDKEPASVEIIKSTSGINLQIRFLNPAMNTYPSGSAVPIQLVRRPSLIRKDSTGLVFVNHALY